MTIDIVGAGIGGLTTAIALKKSGFNVRVFEQTSKMKPVGAGIILANNAMQVYEKLGLKEVIEKAGNPISSMNISNADFRNISTVDVSHFEKMNNVKNIAIHRGVLQQLLLNELKTHDLALNHKLTDIKTVNNEYTLIFNTNEQIRSAMVIGADGLHSTVRRTMFANTKIRHARQICWRGIANFKLPKTYTNELNESWGGRERFGFVSLTENQVYWYALKSFRHAAHEFSLMEIEKYYKKFNSIVNEIIASTPKSAIHTSEISDLKPNDTWCKGKVCLLGDAAHATTPNMGQGACQAIEDAYILVTCLKSFKPVQALLEYQRIRLPKALQVVNKSWNLGKIAHISNPLLMSMRNQTMRIMPKYVNRKQMARIFQLSNV